MVIWCTINGEVQQLGQCWGVKCVRCFQRRKEILEDKNLFSPALIAFGCLFNHQGTTYENSDGADSDWALHFLFLQVFHSMQREATCVRVRSEPRGSNQEMDATLVREGHVVIIWSRFQILSWSERLTGSFFYIDNVLKRVIVLYLLHFISWTLDLT